MLSNTKFVSLLIIIAKIYGQETSSLSCAYTAMGMMATPLNTCSAYSMDSLSYSSKYTFDQSSNSLIWHYYDDLECDNQYKTYEMDDVMMNIHHMNIQTDGLGSNCDTVDIIIYGNYNYMTDECEDDEDDDNGYQTKSLVINECISSPNDGSSAILMCDENQLYFNYCKSSLNCECGQKVEQIIYEYYQDDCFEFECNDNSNDKNLMMSHSQSQPIINKKSDAQFIRNLITQTSNAPFGANKNGAIPTTQKLIKESMPGSLATWLYIVIGGVIFVVCCAISKYINSFKKEYIEI